MQFTYETHPGETLDDIARRFDTTVSDILAINEIPNPHGPFRIRIVIRIPVAMLPPTVPTRRPLTNFATRLVGNILYVLSTDRMLYRRGQPVTITLVKTNIGSQPITLTYRTAQRFDFFVRRSRTGPIIWQLSADQFFAQVIESVVLQPGQSQIFRVVWDQITNDGLSVGTGIFTVIGENVAEELRGRTISVRIRIV
ncbi:MAG: LysM peptidoglycan-binding domain-containing protein [Clostridia bacterium]|jgi:LysM repeat protein|nr:LysM peptidoglycan-binding domain-containing protein [Clostridia bacterium]